MPVTASACGCAVLQVGTAKWYQFLHQTATALANVPAAELALQLFLTCAHSASGERHWLSIHGASPSVVLVRLLSP
jgi:predicted exporter